MNEPVAETYPVVKENCFYEGYFILFTAPKTGRVLSTGTMKYFDLVGHESDCWEEKFFRRTEHDPATFVPS